MGGISRNRSNSLPINPGFGPGSTRFRKHLSNTNTNSNSNNSYKPNQNNNSLLRNVFSFGEDNGRVNSSSNGATPIGGLANLDHNSSLDSSFLDDFCFGSLDSSSIDLLNIASPASNTPIPKFNNNYNNNSDDFENLFSSSGFPSPGTFIEPSATTIDAHGLVNNSLSIINSAAGDSLFKQAAQAEVFNKKMKTAYLKLLENDGLADAVGGGQPKQKRIPASHMNEKTRKQYQVFNEQKRRDSLKASFLKLGELIPSINKKSSRVNIVEKAREHILFLKASLDSLEKESQSLLILVDNYNLIMSKESAEMLH